MKLDTSKDRLNVVKKLFNRAIKINDAFRQSGQYTFGDVLGVMAMMEKLNALEDNIKTEMILEDALDGVYKIKDESAETKEKFVAIFAGQTWLFLKKVLAIRIDYMISFANNDFNDRKLMKFQKDFRETMIEMREAYAEIYGV